MGAVKGGKSEISAAYIRHLLHKRCETNAKKAKPKSTTRRTKRRVTTRRSTRDDEGTTTTRRRRRYKRRRRTATTRTPRRTTTTKPKKKASITIATQTMEFSSEDEDQPTTSRRTVRDSRSARSGDTVKEESKPNKDEKPIKSEGTAGNATSRNGTKRKVKKNSPDVITLSDNEQVAANIPHPDEPSTSSGRTSRKKVRRFGRVYVSEDDSDYEDPRPKKPAKKRATEANGTSSGSPTGKSDPPIISDMTVAKLLAIAPILRCIAKNLPMKSLGSLAQVNSSLREVVEYEKSLPRRQNFDWIHRPSIISSLDEESIVTEEILFGERIQNIYCEPEFVIVFGSPKYMYDKEIYFNKSGNNPQSAQKRNLYSIISDLMPRAANKPLHIRTSGIFPPLPPKTTGNVRKPDHYGTRESTRDLCLLFIPRIPGVNIWHEQMTEAELKKNLKENGWLENRAQNHFLLPMIKELEPIAPKLVLMFSRRTASYENVMSSEFPVIVMNTMEVDGFGRDNSMDYGLEFLAIGGANVTVYQIVLKGVEGREDRRGNLQKLRDFFTAQQVMSGKMLLFYFRNVPTYDTNTVGALLEGDMEQLRETFPRVPIFGGRFFNVIGSVFTKDKAGDSGKFFGGLHSAVICAVLLGQ